jgi:hypothetical protein
MTPRLESMAAYIAALLRIRLSASTGPELRAELEAALAASTKRRGIAICAAGR